MVFSKLGIATITALIIMSNLAGCAAMTPKIQISTTIFKDDAYTLSGTIAVLPADGKLADSLEFRHFRTLIAGKLSVAGYTVIDDVKAAVQLALVSYGIDNGKSEIYSTPIYGSTGGSTRYSSGTVYGSGGSASYSGSSYQMPAFGVVGTGVNTMTTYTRALAVDILEGASFRNNAPKKLLELRSKSSGSCGVMASVLPYVIDGAFTDFPSMSGKAQYVEVPVMGEFNC